MIHGLIDKYVERGEWTHIVKYYTEKKTKLMGTLLNNSGYLTSEELIKANATMESYDEFINLQRVLNAERQRLEKKQKKGGLSNILGQARKH